MGKRKTLDIILGVGAAVMAVLGLANFIVSVVQSPLSIFGAVVGLFQTLVSVVLIIRVLLLAKDSGDSDRSIVEKSDIDKFKDKMK